MFSIMLPGLMSPKLGFLLALAFLALFRSAWKWQIVKWSSRDKSGKIGDEINLFAWRNTYFIATVSKNIDICRDVFFLLFLFSRINVWYNFLLRNFSINSNFRKRLSLNMIYYSSIISRILRIYYPSRKISSHNIYRKRSKQTDNRIELVNFGPNKFIRLYKDIKSG